MGYWLSVNRLENWLKFLDNGAKVDAYHKRKLKTVESIKPKDILIYYISGRKKGLIVGASEAVGKGYYDEKSYWGPKYPACVKVNLLIELKPDNGIPLEQLKTRLELFADKEKQAIGATLLARSPGKLSDKDGKWLLSELKKRGSEAGLAMKETKSESHKTDHDHLKEMLYEIGQMKGRIAQKDLPIYELRLDVAWTKILKWTDDPFNVFVIEAGDLDAAITKLQDAYRKWGSQPILVTSAKGKVEALELIKGKAFQKVKNVIKIIGPEDVAKLHDLYKKVTNLEDELRIK
jgi:hypothetical protein